MAEHENDDRFPHVRPGADPEPDEIGMIRESTAGIVPRDGDRKRVGALRFISPGFDLFVFRQMDELGWIGLRLPEERGSSGLGV